MGRHWNFKRNRLITLGTFLSLLFVLLNVLTGCGGGGNGGSIFPKEIPAGPQPAFIAPEGITTTIIKFDTTNCPEIGFFVSVNDENSDPVEGLTDQNFLVTEDGNVKVIKRINELANVAEPIIFSIAMDYSYSLTDQDVINSENAAAFFVNELYDLTSPLVSWGEIIKFIQDSEVTQAFTDNKDDILSAIVSDPQDPIIQDRINRVRGTGLYDAIGKGIDNMAAFRTATPGLPTRSILIVVTDGKDAFSTTYTKEDNIAAALAENVQIIAIGFGAEVDGEALYDLATETNGLYFYTPTSDDLLGILTQLLDNLKNQYVMYFDSVDPGPHLVAVDVDTPKGADSDELIYECP